MSQTRWLTSKQRAVVDLVMRGESYKQAAFILGMPEGTLRTHILEAYRRLGVHSAREALAKLSYQRMSGRSRTKAATSPYQGSLFG